MTKPRARLPGDDVDASGAVDPATSRLGAVHHPPRAEANAPTAADGTTPLCKLHMRGKPCVRGAACEFAHVPLAERRACWTFARYGVCHRDLERDRDPDAPECWFPHPPAPPARARLAIQCELGASERVASRCRDLLGPDAVVDAARADLSRSGECVLLVRGPDEHEHEREREAEAGAPGASSRATAADLRRLTADPHMLASTRRVYPLEGGHASTTIPYDTFDALVDALRAYVPATLNVAAAAVPGGRARARARCFPKSATEAVAKALGSESNEGRRRFDMCAGGGDATHALDVVCVAGRAYVSVWAYGDVPERMTSLDEARGAANSPSAPSTSPADSAPPISAPPDSALPVDSAPPVVSAPHVVSAPPPGVATWDDLVNHAERVKTHRRTRRALCRAFFKMEEAASRGGVDVGAGWRCVDVGASPGGWTQWLTRRLAEAEAEMGDRDDGSVETADRSGRGHVWSVDPGALTLDPWPKNATHVAAKGEDAAEAIRADAARLGLDERPLRLLVCDANVPPKEVSDILLHLARALGLAKGGWVVTTFKNFCKGYAEWRAHIAAAEQKFRDAGFENPTTFHLFSNCAQEMTMVAKYTGEGLA